MAHSTGPGARRSRRIAASLGLVALAASAIAVSSGSASAGRAPKMVNVQLLAFNDYHGHLESSTPGGVPNPADLTKTLPAGGAEYLSTKLSQLRTGHKNTLTVAAGDLVGGTPFLSGFFHDEPSVESLNAMGLDVSSVGNHEFDEGLTELLRLQRGGCHPDDGCYFPDSPYPGADFKWLAANVVNKRGKSVLPPYWIKEFDDVKVGFIGMTLEDTPTLVAASGIQGLTFKDEVATANALVPKLKKEGVEAIVVLLHEGGAQTVSTIDTCVGISGPVVAINAGLDPEIDAVLTGHTHQAYNCMLPDPAGVLRPVTSAFSFGRVVSEVNLTINARTKDVERSLTVATNHNVLQDVPKDPAQTAIIAKWSPLADTLGNVEVGTITGDITRAVTNGAEDRGKESSAGDMIADAQLWATTNLGAQLALMNPGGVRADFLFASSTKGEGDGVVTFRESFNVQPFGNVLVTIPMTGTQIENALKQQCQPFRSGGQSRPFLHLGVSTGFTYSMSYTIRNDQFRDASGAIKNALNCENPVVSNMQLNGVPIDANGVYQVTVNNFLADGGDNFGSFATVPVTSRQGGGGDLERLNDYLTANPNLAPPTPNRATMTRTDVIIPPPA